MLHAKFKDYSTSGSGNKDFKGFRHIWAWRPTWSSDLDHFYELSFTLSMEAPHKSLQSGFREVV